MEYSQIFDEYVYILESIIESKIANAYSKEQIAEFYNDFKENYKNYEAINSETVEVLFGFIDFVKFKEAVIKFKKQGQKDDENVTDAGIMETTKGADVEEYFNRLHAEGIESWTKSTEVKESKDKPYYCTIWSRPIPGSKIKMLRSELVFKNVNLKQMEGFFDNLEETMRKAPNVKEFHVFEKSEAGMIFYSYSKMPALMSDRDMLIEVKRNKKTETSRLTVLRSIERDDLPIVKKKGVIRMDFYKASLIEQIGEDIKITEYQTMDLKGYFPARLMNMMIGSQLAKGLGPMYKDISSHPKE